MECRQWGFETDTQDWLRRRLRSGIHLDTSVSTDGDGFVDGVERDGWVEEKGREKGVR